MQSGRTQNDRKLIDTIVYMASLVSDPAVIKPQLESLRFITANLGPNAPLTDDGRQQLNTIQSTLENHLLHSDKIRSFTPETLAQALGQQINSPVKRKTLRQIGVIGLIVLATYGVGLAVLLPFSFTQAMITAPMLAFVVMYLCIAWLFWSGLRNFSPQLKRAYVWICAGYIATGLAVCVTPLAVAYPNLADGVLLRYGVILPSILVANLLIWTGMQTFAKAMSIHSWLESGIKMFTIAAVVAIAMFLVPHPSQEPSELWFDVSFSSLGLFSLFAAASSWLAFKISRRTSAMYAKAMGWFSAAMGMIAGIGVVMQVPLLYFVGGISGFTFFVATVLFSIAGMLMIISAYKFKRSSGSS